MTISTKDLQDMVKVLDAMMPKFHASTDNFGKYLGDGIPRAGMVHLRSGLLSEALSELIEKREKENV